MLKKNVVYYKILKESKSKFPEEALEEWAFLKHNYGDLYICSCGCRCDSVYLFRNKFNNQEIAVSFTCGMKSGLFNAASKAKNSIPISEILKLEELSNYNYPFFVKLRKTKKNFIFKIYTHHNKNLEKYCSNVFTYKGVYYVKFNEPAFNNFSQNTESIFQKKINAKCIVNNNKLFLINCI